MYINYQWTFLNKIYRYKIQNICCLPIGYLFICYSCVCIYVCLYVYIYIYGGKEAYKKSMADFNFDSLAMGADGFESAYLSDKYYLLFANAFIYMYAYVYLYIYMYIHTYIHIYICITFLKQAFSAWNSVRHRFLSTESACNTTHLPYKET
jgi:hypothetical protein